ncbi:Wzz/FepE/Etk N-terminal domain-containing protein [Pelomonas sp. APW6]|uniref:Wzz/FepE/Etk N-terminal domain-containing protein n=1 Tax=Roseateles subflavus TaxID=3053353 RepID=A0ABT7LJ66_9BURK|nr:Wzz/FepE/Etk N-terminal domain-containing protein [Pelomonas sp. APW6]MDL5032893.1 Wzz/FepE/Etk N-terminal domain-containing protein [Pelomonas sp. APW6]
MSMSAMPEGQDSVDTLLAVARQGRRIVGVSLLCGVLALGGSYLVAPTFTAATVVLPPQQQQSLAASALSSLGGLAGLAGAAAGGVKSPLDQHVALLQSTTVADRMIDRFKLAEVYDKELRSDVRKKFWTNLRVAAGRRDGLLTIEVDDREPQRAAEMANAMVDEFRRITSEIAITEAQQRKVFFEKHLMETKDRLTRAQLALQQTGLSSGAIKAEPKAAAEAYAKLRAEYTAAEVRLQAMSTNLTPSAPEVMQQRGLVSGLKAQLDRVERDINQAADGKDGKDGEAGANYISRYRDYKYQETLFELFAKQFEMAKVDEGREGGLIQVVDVAQVPDRKSKPKRAFIAAGVSVAVGLMMLILAWLRASAPQDAASVERRRKLKRLLPALLGRG